MGIRRTVLLATIAMVLALLVTASVAAAAARFASPTGSSSNPCTQAAPCDIGTAVNGAMNNDDVTIEPGTYGPTPPVPGLDNVHTLTIHGQAGAPRPVIVSSGNPGINLQGTNSSLSDVEVDMRSVNTIGINSDGAEVVFDRVISHVLGTGSFACLAEFGVTITNSLCVADGSSSIAFVGFSGASTLRNDTLEAPGGSGNSGGIGVEANGSSGGSTIVTLSNSIAHGTMVDLTAVTDSDTTSQATITADHSNYATDTTAGAGTNSVTPHGTATNQTAAPHFANAAQDDFHELSGSPTIGAGFNSPSNGPLDLDGHPRETGGHTDIGAYEFIPLPPPIVHCVVPKLKGKALGKAQTLLTAAHCTLGKVRKPKHHKGKLVVKSQSPSAGTVLANGAKVSVKLGPKPHRKNHR